MNSAKQSRPGKLLSGGNPQIAKAGGGAPVQACIAAMPGGKRGIGELLGALIVGHVPNVVKAVKWTRRSMGLRGRAGFWASTCSLTT